METFNKLEDLGDSETLVDSRELYGGRLAEYLTGLKLNDPKLVERLVEDQKIIRAKYDLPSRDMRFDSPTEFERKLKAIADKYGVRIDSKSECGSFFKDSPAGGVYFAGSNRIGIDLSQESEKSFTKDLGILEHELIHAMQSAHYPGMPIERQEYEAYVAGASLGRLQGETDPESRFDRLNSFFADVVGGSIDYWYRDQSKEQEKEISPEWLKPQFFDKSDEGVS